MSGIPDSELAKTIHVQLAPDYIYTVWQVHHSGGGAVEIMQGTDHDYLLKNARVLSGQKTDVVVTRQEIILDMRRTAPNGGQTSVD